jgi:hypothetical protein
MQSDTQQSRLINYGPDHPRLTFEGKQLLGGVFLILVLVVVAIGFWKQVQAQRKPQRKRDASAKRVDLMTAVKQRDDRPPAPEEPRPPD